jgi:hypothetical protein
MAGENDLEKLLDHMTPELMDGEYVFCSFQDAQYGDYSDLEPLVAIIESEGLTLIIPRLKADEKSIGYESVFKRITLKIHSSLDVVGFTAAFSAKLTEHGISTNVIAGYYHDHIFVQREFAERAIGALNELAR